MLYKREINNKDDAKNVEYIVNSGMGVYINTSILGKNTSATQGLYIKQDSTSNIYLSKMIENIEINGKIYSICDLDTADGHKGGVEYLESFDRYPVPTYTYYIEGCKIIKKYKFVTGTNILCIDYEITNITKKGLKFTTKPCITNRNILSENKKADMKYTSSSDHMNVKVTLNISENINIYLKASNMRYENKEEYLYSVRNILNLDDKLKNTAEDLYVPGYFEANVKPGITKTYSIYVLTEDVVVDGFNSRDIENSYIEDEKCKTCRIQEIYHELKDLAVNAYAFQYIDKANKKFVIHDSMPEIKQDNSYITNVITSLEGNYMLLGRFKEAKKILEAMIKKIDSVTDNLTEYDKCEAILTFIESLNRYIQLSECDIMDVKSFYDYITKKINGYINNNKKDNVFIDEDFFFCIDEKRYIKINSLWYNALRVFVDLSDRYKEKSKNIYEISEKLKENIISKFWDEGSKVLKYELDDRAYANFDMIYSQSLSYPIIHDNISMKIIDTAFKKLYTPLGMRKFETLSNMYDGYIYPHLMVHFIKANLRQMGVTRATQKIAFNLVKDLLYEINKYTVGSVKYKYFEKSKMPCGQALSAITNAELIRMYDMLT